MRLTDWMLICFRRELKFKVTDKTFSKPPPKKRQLALGSGFKFRISGCYFFCGLAALLCFVTILERTSRQVWISLPPYTYLQRSGALLYQKLSILGTLPHFAIVGLPKKGVRFVEL